MKLPSIEVFLIATAILFQMEGGAQEPITGEASILLAEDPMTLPLALSEVVNSILITEPEIAEPEITEPEITEPEITEPEITEPEITEVKSAAPGDDQILSELPDLTVEYMRDLFSLYERLGNEKMASALLEELAKRDPEIVKEMEAARATDHALTPMGGEAAYSEPASPWALEEERFDKLTAARDYEGALAYLEKLRNTKFSGKYFPLDLQLGYTYSSLDRLDESMGVMERIISDPKATAAAKLEARNALPEIRKQMGIRDGYQLLEARKRPAALAAASRLVELYPNDRDVLSLFTAAQVANGQIEEALPTLEKLKSVDFAGESFPGQDAFAEALFAVGRIEEAAAAYDELSLDIQATPRERIEATRAAREIYERLSNRLATDVNMVNEGEGDGVTFRQEVAAQINSEKDQWVGARAQYADVNIKQDSRIIRQSGESQFSAVAFFRDYINGHSYREVRVGGGDYDTLSAGASVGRERVNEWSYGWSVNADVNRPSEDSLQLIALDGTEDVIDVNFEGPVGIGRIQFSTGAHFRQVDLDGVDLGNGGGLYLELSDNIWENKLETAYLNLAYRMEYEKFSSSKVSGRAIAGTAIDSEIFSEPLVGDALIEPEYHPHGLYLTYEHEVSENLLFYLNTGGFYDFADDQFDYQFVAGAEVALTETIDLSVEGAYYSDGTAASDDQGEVLVGSVGLRMYY